MANILWLIVGLFVALWIIGGVLALLGVMIHFALWLLHWALIAALVVIVFNLITGRRRL